MSDQVAVIIINYGTADLSILAAESVLNKRHGGRPVEVHLVDNDSPGEDLQILRRAHAERAWGDAVTLWPEESNHGFGRGNNVILKALAGRNDPPDKVFLLNPDARLENEAIDILATALEENPRAAAAGAGVFRPDLTQVTAAFRFPGALSEIARMASMRRLDQLFEHRLVPLPPDHAAGPVDWVSGASVMFRFEALREAAFFDPEFFLYFEEVDLMRRLHLKNWQVLYVPQARVIHEEGAATGQFAGHNGRHRPPAYLYDSWQHYFAKAYGRARALCIALAMIPAACLNVMHRRLRGQPPTVPLHFFRDHFRYVITPMIFGKRRP